ncbi:MAG: plasmid pRiA4b ORF-3 family protein [Roseomonas sp.]|nr:plasmid pRiA4b ORF-3 family protein [Roseomonas sp.]MCA3290158.1 plasmid pRiA4b ORF-3 family protein [Roseomonas sp.]MCA3293148.1 plasmid pRiA4b ORF-3 family protein [Roseomonas sp.]
MKIARLKITLDDVEPRVMRRVDVPFDIRLDRLHLVIQVAMGWTNSHLYEFRLGETGWGIPNRDFPDDAQDARKATLATLLTAYGKKKFDYIYDFGDCWEHTIAVEKILESVPEQEYPCLIEAQGNCPPEDVGGYPGYEELLAAKADPTHERRQEFEDWMDLDAFDPKTPDTAFIKLALKALAKKWTPKPKTKPAKPG